MSTLEIRNTAFFSLEMMKEALDEQKRSTECIQETVREISNMKAPWFMTSIRVGKIMKDLCLRLEFDVVDYFHTIACPEKENKDVHTLFHMYSHMCKGMLFYQLDSLMHSLVLTDQEKLILDEFCDIAQKVRNEKKKSFSDRDIITCRQLTRDGANNQTRFYQEIAKRYALENVLVKVLENGDVEL